MVSLHLDNHLYISIYIHHIVLIVHCTGGVSRSPAVAAGIVAGLGGDDACFWSFERYHPNPRVYEWVRAAFETGIDPSKKEL